MDEMTRFKCEGRKSLHQYFRLRKIERCKKVGVPFPQSSNKTSIDRSAYIRRGRLPILGPFNFFFQFI